MYEKDAKFTPQHAPQRATQHAQPAAQRVPGSTDTGTRTTDPKFVRESFTMRKMQTWQIAALAIAAAVVVALAVFYF